MSCTSSPLLIVISAPSGAGKTTLCQHLLSSDQAIHRAITCTTRAPRPGEVPGRDYYFMDMREFESHVQHEDFLEHATVFSNRYGTLKSEVLKHLEIGHDVLLNIDVQGAESIRYEAAKQPKLQHSLVTVFLTPPSMVELEFRLRNRASESEEHLQQRLSQSRLEIAHYTSFDYLILSGTREQDLERMHSIVQAERLKRHRQVIPTDLLPRGS